jgi:hypothetical protein
VIFKAKFELKVKFLPEISVRYIRLVVSMTPKQTPFRQNKIVQKKRCSIKEVKKEQIEAVKERVKMIFDLP